MTALGKLVRTTAFKIIAVYLIVFAIFAMAVIGYLARHTQALVVSQITETIDAEIRNLEDIHADAGIGRLIDVVSARAQQPGSNLYVVTSFNGAVLVANVTDIGNATLSRQGWARAVLPGTNAAMISVLVYRACTCSGMLGCVARGWTRWLMRVARTSSSSVSSARTWGWDQRRVVASARGMSRGFTSVISEATSIRSRRWPRIASSALSRFPSRNDGGGRSKARTSWLKVTLMAASVATLACSL